MKSLKITITLFVFSIASFSVETVKTQQTGGSQSSWNGKQPQGSPNIYDSSKQAEKKNNLGVVINGVGAAFTGVMAVKSWMAYEACSGTCGNELMAATMFTMMAMQSLSQVAENSKKQGEYGNLANSFGCSDPKLCTVSSPDVKPDADGNFLNNVDFKDDKLNGKKAEMKKNLAALKKAGIGIDFGKNKVTMPNGQSFDGSKLKTDKDWEKMFGEGSKKLLSDANKSINDEMKKLLESGGLDDSSTGFAGSKSNLKGSSLEDGLGLGTGSVSSAIENQSLPLSTDGLTKLYNGEAVGLASDNIFSMMSRRYKFKEKKGEFLNENGDE
jgi:hypothetical protein